ncbi:MAG: DMT family transporter [Hyphomicrobiales bacterium]|nr:DMT family transporter [Hyphomicrobiales bacterium]
MPSALLWTLGVLAGVLIPVQTALNAQLGRTAGHPLLTTLVVFIVGGVACALGLAVVRPFLPDLAAWRAAPPVAWGGGIIAMAYVVLLVFLAPRIGVGLTTALVLVGQLAAALALDHFGALGNPVHALNLARALGFVLMVAGVALIKIY